MSTAPVSVLVADDHPLFRQGLRAALETEPGIRVVGEASDGAEAVALALELGPDVVVMDIGMPAVSGLDATRRLAREAPEVAVLVLTMFEGDDSVFAAMRAGARGYLLKGADQGEITRAVRAVHAGEAIFGPGIARRMATWFSARQATAPFPQLTERERQVLDLVARGQGNAAIARSLVLSEKTVRNHVSNIFTKLRVPDRPGAIVRAREAGLGEPTER